MERHLSCPCSNTLLPWLFVCALPFEQDAQALTKLALLSVPLQNIIAEHEIRNISCAAQDPEDLCTFAYITKDLQTNHHYCHVFSTVDVVRTTITLSDIHQTIHRVPTVMSIMYIKSWNFKIPFSRPGKENSSEVLEKS